MAKEPVCLFKESRAQLARIDPSTPIHSVARFADVIIGFSTTESIPSSVLLPAGLEWCRTDELTAVDLLDAEDVQLPPIITLRYRVRTQLSSPDAYDLIDSITTATIVTIDDILLPEDQNLADVITDADDPLIAHGVQLFTKSSAASENGDAGRSAPAFNTLVTNAPSFDVVIDVVAHVVQTATRQQVIDALSNAVRQNARKLYDAKSSGFGVSTAHFGVFGGSLAATVVSSQPMPDVQLNSDERSECGISQVEGRKAVHNALCLPVDRPLVRHACRAYTMRTKAVFDGGWSGRLSDVHIGIKSHGLGDEDVTVHTVDGHYLYYHYLQDKMNDSGWGCAYRSLQTLLSWCAFQKYANFANGVLPTHEAIQRALVDVGDKPTNFIGSKEWIGANEVCYALEKLTGVESKILHVSRGSEMTGKSREMGLHFDEQGSPIMIGGGVLAWTILGVARNSRTGKSKFLILDPHFEGRDDLSIIQNKGWVAWKGEDIFKDAAFYNLCMPQRPSGV